MMSVVIDGASQPGYTGTPVIEIAGNSAGFPVNGLWIQDSASGSTVQGLSIGGFTGAGILISFGTANTIRGNYVGVKPDGVTANPNRDGIYLLNAFQNPIGGPSPDDRNLISGNNDDGVNLEGVGAIGNGIIGNWIGTDSSGTSALPNQGDGIKIGTLSSENLILANRIAFNVGRGIYAEPNGPPVNNRIGENSIFSNNGLGIDLNGDGITANDSGDGDAGPNNLQNFPTIAVAARSATQTQIGGSLTSSPSTTFQIEFFSNTACDPSGNGQGQTFIGSASVTTDSSGKAAFQASTSLVPLGSFITSTATTPSGSTSEFSNCMRVTAVSPANGAPTRGAVVVSSDVTLTWNRVSGGLGYSVRVATDAAFTQIVYSKDSLAADVITHTVSLPAGEYFWQVRTRTGANTFSLWSLAQPLLILQP